MYKILAVDYANLLYRSYWSAKGQNIPGLAVFRFAQALYISMRQSKCNTLFLAGESFTILNRTKFDRTYKSGRKQPLDQDFVIFSSCLREMLKVMGLNIIHYPGYEGDDVIAALCKMNNRDKIYIMSADKDLRQLLRKDRIVILQSDTNRSLYTENDFYKEHGFMPEWYHIYKALIGDKSDSVDGVYGFGPVQAKKIMTMDNFEEGLNMLTPDEYAQFRHALKLVQLDPTVPCKTFKGYLTGKYCTNRQFRISKKIFLKYYGENLCDGVINEFKKLFGVEDMSDKIIAVDFDGILVDELSLYNVRSDIFDLVTNEQQYGAKIILWTRRFDEKLKEAVELCEKQGLKFDAINGDLSFAIDKLNGSVKNTKIFAHEYWDNSAVDLCKLRAV